jgi:ribosomal protein S27E
VSLVKDSGQMWKLRVAFGALVCLIPLMAVSDLLGLFFEWLDPAIFALLGAGVVWVFVAVRCPYCRASLAWHRWFRQDQDWEPWIWKVEQCPKCGMPERPIEHPMDAIECRRCGQLTSPGDFCDTCGLDLRTDLPPVVTPDASDDASLA